VRTVGIRLTADVSQYMTSLKRAGLATSDLTGQLDKAAKAGKLDKVADQALKFGIVGAAAFGYVVKSAADFDKQMSAVSAATHASAGDMNRLREAALQAGKDTQFSATQAADGVTQLAKAGVSATDILGGGLKGALSLAAAGQLDVGEAAETAATAMTQFGLKGSQIPHVADLLAAAAGKAQGSVHDMGFALKQSGLVASQFGLSVEDTTGTLAAFASAGLIGSDAGTSFKTMLLSLANPAEKTQKLMAKLGISAYDAQGQFVGITNLAGQLQTKLGGLTQAQRDAALAQIFGTDAIRAANVLYKNGAAGIQGWINKTNDAGYAAETAAKLTDNLAGDIERLKGSLETLAIESGSGANSGIRVLTKGLNGLVDQFGQMPAAVGSTATVLVGVGGAAALGLAGFVKLRRGVASATAELNAMGPVGEKAAVGVGKAASAAGKAALAFAALQVVGAVASSFRTDLNPQIDAATKGLEAWNGQATLAGESARLFGTNSEDLDRALNGLASHGFSHATDAVTDWVLGVVGIASPLDDAKEKVAAFDAVLTALVQGGHAATALAFLQARAKDTGVSIDDLKKLLPGYAGALEVAGVAANNAAGSTKGLTISTEDAKKAADDAAEAFKTLFGVFMSADQAEIKFQQALVNTNKELREGKRTLDIHKQAGRDNRNAVLDEIDAINDLRTATINQGGSVEGADKKYRANLETLRKHLISLGYDKKAVNDLITKYKNIPGKVDTKVGTPGLKASDTGVKNYDKKLDQLAREIITHVNVIGVSGANAELETLLIKQQALKHGTSIGYERMKFRQGKYAEGGWTGPGPKYQPAGVVHADEFVIQKESRQKIESRHPGALDQMNRTGRLPGYARGGLVLNVPFPVTAAMTKIPSLADVLGAVGGAGGMGYKWMEAVVHAAFPGMRILSDLRPGARTLSGNVSYHALGRAVDFPPSLALAEWINLHYKARTKELITPWNSLNIHNGQRHTYTGAVWNQHNFAGGNAHDHWAMSRGGMLNEPVWGIGASGRTYSLAENGPEAVVPTRYITGSGTGSGAGGGSSRTYQITVYPTPLAHPRDIGREIKWAIQQYEAANG
jgi:TP901 family phage tail tape measure protein